MAVALGRKGAEGSKQLCSPPVMGGTGCHKLEFVIRKRVVRVSEVSDCGEKAASRYVGYMQSHHRGRVTLLPPSPGWGINAGSANGSGSPLVPPQFPLPARAHWLLRTTSLLSCSPRAIPIRRFQQMPDQCLCAHLTDEETEAWQKQCTQSHFSRDSVQPLVPWPPW